MSWDRREILGSLGIASASTLAWALGCGRSMRVMRPTPRTSADVRTWLRSAVERIAVWYPEVHALAVTRRRTTAAIDVLGTGVARSHTQGLIFTFRDRDGTWHDHVTTDLTEVGVATAVAAVIGPSTKRASVDFGDAPTPPPEPTVWSDHTLRDRIEHLLPAPATV